jgi:hypothetical protein
LLRFALAKREYFPQSFGVTKKPASLTPTQALEGAVRRLLRPLLRLLVENQIALGRLVELIKETLVDMAERDIKSAGGTPTDTRIHLLTGVHRKDVRRLRRTSDEAPTIPPTVSLGGQIIARWTSDAACLDRAGRPRVLPLSAPAGEMSFKTLVDEIGRQDIRPRAALEELQRLGVIELDGDDRVRLQMEAFVPEKGFTEKAFYFGQNLRDHLAAGARNLRGTQPPLLDRSVYYDHLSPESVAELTDLARASGMQALLAFNRRAAALQKRDAGRADSQQRVNFGAFFYHAPNHEE